MAEKNLHRQAQRGVRVMLGRQVFLQGLTLVFGVLLARILDPADFGLFGITTFVVGMLKLLGDCGIAPSLIQRSTEVTEGDLKTAFTLQQILVTGAFAALWFLAPLAPSVYPRGGEPLMWLIRVLGINLYLQSWRSIGVVVLERGMRYRAVAVVEIVESVSYQLIAVVLAYLGFGVWSLVAAVLVRSFLGAGMVVNLARFKP
ncbi:MAG: teichuronic acid exporter, partial [Rhodothermales bacterium]